MVLRLIIAPVAAYFLTILYYVSLATISGEKPSGTIEQEFYTVSNIFTTYVLCQGIVKKLTEPTVQNTTDYQRFMARRKKIN